MFAQCDSLGLIATPLEELSTHTWLRPSPLTALKKSQVPLSPGTGPSREQNPQGRKVADRTSDHSQFAMQIGNANSPSHHRNQPFIKKQNQNTLKVELSYDPANPLFLLQALPCTGCPCCSLVFLLPRFLLALD